MERLSSVLDLSGLHEDNTMPVLHYVTFYAQCGVCVALMGSLEECVGVAVLRWPDRRCVIGAERSGVVIRRSGQNGPVCVRVRQCVCGTSINESTPPTRLVWTNTGLYGALSLSLSMEFVKLKTYK